MLSRKVRHNEIALHVTLQVCVDGPRPRREGFGCSSRLQGIDVNARYSTRFLVEKLAPDLPGVWALLDSTPIYIFKTYVETWYPPSDSTGIER